MYFAASQVLCHVSRGVAIIGSANISATDMLIFTVLVIDTGNQSKSNTDMEFAKLIFILYYINIEYLLLNACIYWVNLGINDSLYIFDQLIVLFLLIVQLQLVDQPVYYTCYRYIHIYV